MAGIRHAPPGAFLLLDVVLVHLLYCHVSRPRGFTRIAISGALAGCVNI
jgi:hypothetical protein